MTLVGPPGIGKTRVSLAVAAGCVPRVADGVVFVALAPAARRRAGRFRRSRRRSASPTAPGSSLIERLHASLRRQRLLLVLDNCEQVVAAARTWRRCCQASPRLTVLATSRTPLHLRGEHAIRGATAGACPTRDQVTPAATRPGAVRGGAAVRRAGAGGAARLCADRGRTPPAVAAICRRLDGLPLAHRAGGGAGQAASRRRPCSRA